VWGDTLWSLSREYGVSIDDLVRWNNLPNDRATIFRGQTLNVDNPLLYENIEVQYVSEDIVRTLRAAGKIVPLAVEENTFGNTNSATQTISMNTGVMSLLRSVNQQVSGVGDSSAAEYAFNGESSRGSFFDRTNTVLGAGGFVYGGLETLVSNKFFWIDANGNIRSVQELQRGANGKYIRGVQGIRNSQAAANRAAGLYQNASRSVAVVSVVVTGIDIGRSGQVNASHLLNLTVTGLSAIPVGGWIFGGVYLITDLTVRGVTGNSIGGHLDNAVGEPVFNLPW
jgi:LysM repeat protein